jgi:hypothetical protein
VNGRWQMDVVTCKQALLPLYQSLRNHIPKYRPTREVARAVVGSCQGALVSMPYTSIAMLLNTDTKKMSDITNRTVRYDKPSVI